MIIIRREPRLQATAHDDDDDDDNNVDDTDG